jgi:hypothetical protein
MVIVSGYQLIENPTRGVFVRSGEQHFCPCCSGSLVVIGSRRRGFVNGVGERVVLVIRRLKCKGCGRIHHELPDILVPYKRYSSESIEAVITGEQELTVVADESTISRWRDWFFSLAGYFAGCLISIAARYVKNTVEDTPSLSGSPLQSIWYHVGDAPRWLARVVRPVVNTNLWVQTRSAFLSG